MNILLTKEEYEERIVNNLVNIGKQSFNLETINDYIAYEALYKLAEETYTNHLMFKDTCNQLFLSAFHVDKNGNLLKYTMFDITKEECEEFHSQKWFQDYVKKQKERYYPYYKLQIYDKDYIDPCWKIGYTPNDVVKVIQQYYTDNLSHYVYSATEKAFEILFGHKYDTDNIKPILTAELIPSN